MTNEAPPCEHEWKSADSIDDFQSGQEFEVYVCVKCGKREYSEVPQ